MNDQYDHPDGKPLTTFDEESRYDLEVYEKGKNFFNRQQLKDRA